MKKYFIFDGAKKLYPGYKDPKYAFDVINDLKNNGFDTTNMSVKEDESEIQEGTIIDSKAVTTYGQLCEIFRDHCGIRIEDKVYFSMDAITEDYVYLPVSAINVELIRIYFL